MELLGQSTWSRVVPRKKFEKYFGTQEDWNITLITKLNGGWATIMFAIAKTQNMNPVNIDGELLRDQRILRCGKDAMEYINFLDSVYHFRNDPYLTIQLDETLDVYDIILSEFDFNYKVVINDNLITFDE